VASPDLFAALQRRPKILILAFTVTVLLAVAVLQVTDLWTQRRQTLKAAERRAVNLTSVLAEYVRGSFALADVSLRQLGVHSRRVGGPRAPGEYWTPLLKSAQAALPGSGAFSVADASGIIRHATRSDLIGQSRRDQYIFRHLAETNHDEYVVDTPFLADPGRYVIPIGRRLTNDKGGFGGVVVTVVSPEAYRPFIRTIDVGSNGSISVFHPEGFVVFREPSTGEPLGDSAADNPLFLSARRTTAEGVIEGAIQPGGPVFLSAVHRLEQPPLIVSVSLDRDSVLADWRHQRDISSVAFAGLTMALAGVVFVLFRQIDARSRAERDLAEIQRIEAARLRDANERLEEALSRERQARRETEAASYLKDEFLMTVSHELRTPLTAIYGWVRMLRTGAIPTDQRASALAAVERNATAQTRLIEDLLDVSRAISGKLRIDARRINLLDVVGAAVETVRPALEAKGLEFERSIEHGDLAIVADPNRVQQIVWNLLSNAIKFTPRGGTVRLEVKRDGTDVEITVGDTGAGIASDFLPYVFERFRQGEGGTRRRFGGLGLGLAIVRHLAELHGGTVTAESQGEGHGSTFRVRLPARGAPGDAEPGSAPDLAVAPAGAARLDGIRVLVVDDEAEARKLFASILESAGAAVLTADSAAEAMHHLAAEREIVLLSDIEMPGTDGYELVAQAMAQSQARGIRLGAIAVTAHARPADRQRAFRAGFDAHLAKPVEPTELIAIVSEVVNSQAPRPQIT